MWIFKADISGYASTNYIGPKVPRISTVNGVRAPSRNTHDHVGIRIWCWCNAHHGVEPARRCNEQSEKRSEPMHSLHVCGSEKDALASQEITHLTIRGVVGYQ